jgi:putative intracellular protease/amidase
MNTVPADSREPLTPMGGLRVVPDLTFTELKPQASAVLVRPGGDVRDINPAATESAVRTAQAFLAADVPGAAICGATAGLARAGLVDNRDGGLITAGPTHPVECARAAFEQFDLLTPAFLDAWYRRFGQQDSSAFAVLAGAQA